MHSAVIIFYYAECHSLVCRYAECRDATFERKLFVAFIPAPFCNCQLQLIVFQVLLSNGGSASLFQLGPINGSNGMTK